MRNKILPLMQREWLQHRFAWALMAVVPLGLGLALTGFGTIDIDAETAGRVGDELPAVMAMATIAACTGLMFLIACAASAITVTGLARRDHGDRSIEFWLSLPAGHAQSLAVPLGLHLVLVPAAGLLVGLAGGMLVSLLLVGRATGVGSWFALPWLEIAPAALALTLRVIAGLPLAVLWLLPLVVLTVLLTAWLGRWGLVVLFAVLVPGSVVLKQAFGQGWLAEIVKSMFEHAGRALVFALDGGIQVKDGGDVMEALRNAPAWALSDFGHALADLASPLMAGGLLFAVGCFWLLVQWRRRGAGAAG